MSLNEYSPDDIASELRQCVQALQRSGRYDLILQAVGALTLEQLKLEQAKAKLSRLVITADYRFLLPDYDKEVSLSPVHKAVYLLFLNHPEGIEFKQLCDYREELYDLYLRMAKRMNFDRIEDSIAHLTNPLDNAINEKCSRIKKAFTDIMDIYTANFYIISSRAQIPVAGSGKIWFRRLKVINLPRHLVVNRTAVTASDLLEA